MNLSLLRSHPMKRYWLMTVVAIISLSVFGRKLQYLLTGILDFRLLAAVVFIVLFAAVIFFLRHRVKYGISRRVLFLTVLLLGAGVFALVQDHLLPIEAVHFLLFMWLGWVSVESFGVIPGLIIVACVAAGDEILQGFLPDRVGDLHDVSINFTSGILGGLLRGKNAGA